MNPLEVWESLLKESAENPIELETKTGLNFKLASGGIFLIVFESEKEPSSKLKSPRPIYKENFLKVFPYYEKWVAEEKGISKEITSITVNSVYIMAGIKYQLNQTRKFTN
ncbi:hypothetical protein MKX96_05970 [Psychrobacillus sp. FSL W7-1493]|uniref:hypothetical protein n=1 Tax=Psychrobacillus sp. FSL W7-1493 TaxID=2921552 RepID=UPI0030F72A99